MLATYLYNEMAYFASGEGISRTLMVVKGPSPPTTPFSHHDYKHQEGTLTAYKLIWKLDNHLSCLESLRGIYWKKRVTFFISTMRPLTPHLPWASLSLLARIAALFNIKRAKWKSVQEPRQTDYSLIAQIQQVLETKWQNTTWNLFQKWLI